MRSTNTNFDAKHDVNYKKPLYLVKFFGEETDYCNQFFLSRPDDANLIGYWPFDESSGSTAEDLSGNGNDGTLEGSMTDADWVAGISGNCLDFDGTDDRVDCGNSAPLDDIGNGDFSISFWMKSGSSILNYGRLFDKRQDETHRLTLQSQGTNNRVRMGIEDGVNKVAQNFSTSSTIFDELWHHIVWVIDRTNDLAYLYIDGVKDATEIDISSLAADFSNTGNVSWGARDNGSNPYLGKIEEPRIYDAILTPEEIRHMSFFGRTVKPYLKSIQGLGQQDVPEEGRATIDGVTVEITDKDQAITALLATDSTSYFQRRAVEIKAGYAGMAETDLITVMPKGRVTDYRYNPKGGSWIFEITDPRKYFDKKIFRTADDTSVVLQGNPIDIYLSILMSSGTPGTNHAFYDRYATDDSLGLTTDDVDVSAIEAIRDDHFPGNSHYMKITVDDRETAREFFIREFFKPLNLRPAITGEGKISLRVFKPPLPATAETQAFTKDNTIGHPKYYGNLEQLFNMVEFSYNHDGDDFADVDVFIDSTSEANRGPGTKSIEIKSRGFHTSISGPSINLGFISDIFERRANSVFVRFGTPPVKIEIACHFSRWLTESGDVVEFTHEDVPDIEAGALGYSNRRMEVLNRRIDWKKGLVRVTLLDTGFAQSTYQIISPTMTITAAADGENFTVSAADAAKYAQLTGYEIQLVDSKGRQKKANVTLLTVNTSTGACTCDDMGLTPVAGDIVMFANYDDCTTAQKVWGFIADSGNKLGTDNDDAHVINP